MARQMCSSDRKSEVVSAKARWALAAASLAVLGAFAWVGHAQAGGDHEDFRQGLFLAGLEQHAAQCRVERQSGEFAAEWSERVRVVERAEFVEQSVARADGRGQGRIEERKRLDLAQPERLHAQDDLREVGALDFGLGEFRGRFSKSSWS